jgi:hypothetical protein
MYSPLTLFADACSADADAYEFNKRLVNIENKFRESENSY